MWSLFSSEVFVDSGKKMKAREGRWEGQAERTPFPLPIFHRQLTITIFIGIASGGLSGGDSRVVASLLSTPYFFLLKRPLFYG